jgi:hypothetical protein
MQYRTDFHSINSRHYHLADELSSGCDPDFDEPESDLAREFAELRLILDHH